MFYLPLNATEAVWMRRDLPEDEYELWISSYSGQIVFCFWGGKQLDQGQQLKLDSRAPDAMYRDQLLGRLKDGYKVLATFEKGKWTDAKDPKVVLLETLPMPKGQAQVGSEKLILTFGKDLELPNTMATEAFALYQYAGIGAGTALAPAWRIDQYKYGDGITDTYSQTRFDSPEQALFFMRKMADKRLAKGLSCLPPSGDESFCKAFTQDNPWYILPASTVMQSAPTPDHAPADWFW